MAGTRSEKARSQDRRWAELVAGTGKARPSFRDSWASYRGIFGDRDPVADGPPRAWQPSPEVVAESNLDALRRELALGSYRELHAWSARERPEFWRRVIDRLGVVLADVPGEILDPTSDVRDPRWLPGASMNVVDSCLRAPQESPAIVSRREGSDELRVTTVAQLERLVNRVAKGLLASGFAPGDAIALYLPMTVECVAAYLGIVRAGCVVVSIADSFTAAEVAKRIGIAGAKGIVTVDAQRRAGKRIPMYAKVREAGAARAIVIPGGEDPLPTPRRGDLLWEELLSHGESGDSSLGDPVRPVNVLFSSGTTGTPKAIPWNHLTPIKGAMDGHFHQDIHPGDVVAWPTNIGWMMGPWLIFASLMNRATIALFEGAPVGEEFTRFVADAKVTMLGVVPALVKAWRGGGHLAGKRWPDVRVFSSTGEPSNVEDYLWLMSRTGFSAPVIEYLGGTEIGGGHITGTVVQPASPATFTTPALGLDFHLLAENGRPVPRGDAGELFLVPPSIGLSQTLWNADHAKTYYEGTPRGPHGEVLRRHGDQFARLGGDFYKAQGRVDDTMNLGGIKVGSLELERVMDAHPAISECAAVGVQLGGEGAERLVVYAVLSAELAREDSTRPTPETLRTDLGLMLAERLNPLFRIHQVFIAESLPRTASNKLMRRKLQSRYREEQGARS